MVLFKSDDGNRREAQARRSQTARGERARVEERRKNWGGALREGGIYAFPGTPPEIRSARPRFFVLHGRRSMGGQINQHQVAIIRRGVARERRFITGAGCSMGGSHRPVPTPAHDVYFCGFFVLPWW